MYQISYTTANVSLRSSPFDPSGHGNDNTVVALPPYHPVTVIGASDADWVFLHTVLKNVRYEGYLLSKLLKDGGGRSEPVPHAPNVPQRDAVLLDVDSAALKDHLTIKRPSGDINGSEALTFRRSRRIDLTFDDVMNPKLTEGYLATVPRCHFKQAGTYYYFWRHWSRLLGNPAAGVAVPVEQGTFCFPKIRSSLKTDSAGKTIPGTWGARWWERVIEWSDPQNGFALKHPVADRYFFLVPENGHSITNADFADVDALRNTLETKVATIKQCVPEVLASGELKDFPHLLVTETASVDLGPALILRQASELDALAAFTEKLSNTADELGAAAVNQLLDESQVNSLIQAVLTMKSPDVDRKLRKAELIDRATALGYKLAEKQEKFTFEDGSFIDLYPGELYRPYQTQVTWVTEHRRQSSYSDSGVLGIGASSGSREWTEFVRHYKTVTKYQKVRVDLDPFSDEEEWLAGQGYESYRFERISGQYRTANGFELGEVMARCEYDEGFRRRCAVWLPVYEQKISKGLMLTGYTIVKRPHLGIRPVRVPKVYFEETLSYRTSWEGAELGELVYTMNLAPGEDRTLTIEQRTTRSTEDVKSTVSVLDLTESSSQELSTEIEKEARSTSDQSSSNTWSVTASGSYGGVGGSSSFSGENRTSTSQFARNFEKIAKKAASNITRNTKQEVRSTSTAKSETSRTEATTIKIRNINEGRTLNLLFYRLYNILRTGIHAEDLEFINESGIEVVAGSGITLPIVRNFERLATSLRTFNLDHLPFEVDVARSTLEYSANYLAYWHLIIGTFIKLIESEYLSTNDTKSGLLGNLSDSQVGQLDDIKNAIKPRLISAPISEEDLEDEIDSVLIRLERLIVSLVETADLGDGKALAEEKKLRVASPGLYVDSLMGLRPATEPYSEEMRAQAVLLKSAEAEKERALASYYRRLGGEIATSVPPNTRIFIGGVVAGRTIRLEANAPLQPGAWVFLVDGKEECIVQWAAGAVTAVAEIGSDPGWTGDINSHAFILRNSTANEVAAVIMRHVE